MQALSVLSHVSSNPVLFVRAMRSCIDAAGNWIEVSDELSRQSRYTHIFSSIQGFFGIVKLRKIVYSGGANLLEEKAWMVANRVKKFASSIAWFCRAGRDLHYWDSRWVGWTAYLKVIRIPFDCISLGFSVLKVVRVCIAWLELRQKSKNEQVLQEAARLQEKIIKKLLYCGAKAFDISALVLEQASPALPTLLLLNSLVSSAIKTTALFYITFTSSRHACKTPSQQRTRQM